MSNWLPELSKAEWLRLRALELALDYVNAGAVSNKQLPDNITVTGAANRFLEFLKGEVHGADK
jgi:hypothetical protein